jgi:hypothetical protein
MTIKWDILFDGSTDPGTVVLGDGVISARASFKTDADAKLFFGMLNEMRDNGSRAERAVERMKEMCRRTIEEGSR